MRIEILGCGHRDIVNGSRFYDMSLCGLQKGSMDFADGQWACPRLSRRVGHGEARWYLVYYSHCNEGVAV